MKGYFITGSDTGVGKTWVSCQLIQQLVDQGHRVKARKPVESGCSEKQGGRLLPTDGLALFEANRRYEDLDTITPYRFSAALAPDRAAQLEGIRLTLENLLDAVTAKATENDLMLVEGAGGFYSPIASNALNADLARELGLKVIIVVDDRLGAINQALLTIRAVQSEGLSVDAVVLNQLAAPTDELIDNLTDLQSRQDVPVYHCPFNGKLPELHLL